MCLSLDQKLFGGSLGELHFWFTDRHANDTYDKIQRRWCTGCNFSCRQCHVSSQMKWYFLQPPGCGFDMAQGLLKENTVDSLAVIVQLAFQAGRYFSRYLWNCWIILDPQLHSSYRQGTHWMTTPQKCVKWQVFVSCRSKGHITQQLIERKAIANICFP